MISCIGQNPDTQKLIARDAIAKGADMAECRSRHREQLKAVHTEMKQDIKNNPRMGQLGTDLVNKIFDYLLPNDIQTIQTQTAQVCKQWQQSLALQQQRQRALLSEYPLHLVRAFNNADKPIYQLPQLDLKGRMGWTGCIDFIQPEDMSHSVMRFRDRYNQPGVAIKIRAGNQLFTPYERGQVLDDLKGALKYLDFTVGLPRAITRAFSYLSTQSPTKTVVLAIAPHEGYWCNSWGNSDDTIVRLYSERSERSAQYPSGITSNTLTSILLGQDPDFSLPPDGTLKQKDGRGIEVLARCIAVAAIGILFYNIL